jgi:SNF2 family DNA or RNA helicase
MTENNIHDDIEDAEIIHYENALLQAAAEYEDIADIYNEDEETLTQLLLEERELQEKILANRQRQSEIKNKRRALRVDLDKAEKAKNEAEDKYNESLRMRRLEEEKASAFIKMVEDARAANYKWVDYAKPHQWEGAMTIAHYGSVIESDDTGLGKTLTTVMSCDLKGAKTVLVVTPNDVVSGFALEFQNFAPHRQLLPIQGANPAMRKMVKQIVENSNEFVIVVNYESLWRDNAWLANVDWDVIIVDEAHNMKEETSLTYDAINSYNYKSCVPVTATTILNSPGDLFTLLHLIAPDKFWGKRRFLDSYCMQNLDNKWIFRPGGEKELMRNLKGRIIKRSYEEAGIQLPSKVINEVVIPVAALSEQQRTIMKQIDEYAEIALESGESTSITAMIAVITRGRQASTFPAGIEVKMTEKMHEQFEAMGSALIPDVGTVIFKVPDSVPSIKLDMAESKLERKVKEGKRCVVFSQFKTALADLERRLIARGVRVVRYDGDTNKNIRAEVKRDFLRNPDGSQPDNYKYDVVLCNYKTGGVGLTFTGATYMLCPDEEWNPAKNHQAISRIHRIGQTEPVEIDILRFENSIDMWMKTVNEVKKAIVEGFESEIDLVESLRQYLHSTKEVSDSPMKAIEKAPIEDIDMDLDFLEGF